MLATITAYHIHEFNNVDTEVGELVFNRATMICNLHLFDIGKDKKLYNYICEFPKEITSYNFPLQTEYLLTSKINVTEKIIADLFESSLGGLFLTSRNLIDCFNYFKKFDIPFVEEGKKKFKQTKGIFKRSSKWKSIIKHILI